MRCTSAIDASIMAMASLEGAALPAAAAVAAVAALKGMADAFDRRRNCTNSKANLLESLRSET
jgi:hypothetical protein